MKKLFLKPKAGLKIPRPDTGRALAPEGEYVPKSTYWLRRIADGDVMEVADKVEKPKVDASKAKEGGKK